MVVGVGERRLDWTLKDRNIDLKVGGKSIVTLHRSAHARTMSHSPSVI